MEIVDATSLEDLPKNMYEAGCRERQNGQLKQAHDHFVEAIRLNPNVAAYHLNLALTLSDLAKPSLPVFDKAIIHAAQAAKLAPDIVGNWIGLGQIANIAKKYAVAKAAYERAIMMQPDMAELYTACGFAYAQLNEKDKAMELYHKGLELDPEMGDVHFLLSCEYQGDRFDPAKQAFHGERGFTANKPTPLQVESCWNAAHGFLGIGDYEKGWKYFESRHNPNLSNAGQQIEARRFKTPLWNGEGDCIVRVSVEMGFGDVFWAVRYLPLIERDFNVKFIFECHQNMIQLMKYNFPGVLCIPYGDPTCTIFDYLLPILSLPWASKNFQVPWNGAYLRAEPKKIEEWRGKIKLCRDKPNIGICWAAGKQSQNAENHETSRRKSVPFEVIDRIIGFENANFVSLQVGFDDPFPHPGIKDFSDTAAIISLMDVVISVDSAVANLAGAMGKELWLMDRWDHDWRWRKLDWFPNTKIFRQETPQRWQSVCDKIYAALSEKYGKITNHAA